MDPNLILAARSALAAERHIEEAELERTIQERLVVESKREEERTPECLGYAEWEALLEGGLSTGRLEHAASCTYCQRIQQRLTPDRELVDAFVASATSC